MSNRPPPLPGSILYYFFYFTIYLIDQFDFGEWFRKKKKNLLLLYSINL